MEALHLLERQLEEMAMAENHCRWTDSGFFTLVGDVGTFGKADMQVVAIDGVAGKVKVRAVDGGRSKSVPFSDVKVFVRRSRLVEHTKGGAA